MTDRHHCRIRYVVTCTVCGDVDEVETISHGSKVCDDHEHLANPERWGESEVSEC